jgi:tRNA-2-methylthio-N6-dimethylallyladenosine synthase
LSEIVALQNSLSFESNRRDVGKVFEVLIEGESKRSDQQWMGRSSQYKVMVFDKSVNHTHQKGDYVMVKVDDFTQATLLCTIVN